MKKLMVLGVLLISTVAFSDDFSRFDHVTWMGVDQSGQPCRVLTNLGSYDEQELTLRFSIASLQADEWTYVNDMTVLLPPQNKGKGGECSLIAAGNDTFRASNNTWVARERKIEFVRNWIQQTTFIFDNAQFSNLKSLEIKEGAIRASGPSACRAIDKNELQSYFICNSLQPHPGN
jgi:hypothetical protein